MPQGSMLSPSDLNKLKALFEAACAPITEMANKGAKMAADAALKNSIDSDLGVEHGEEGSQEGSRLNPQSVENDEGKAGVDVSTIESKAV